MLGSQSPLWRSLAVGSWKAETEWNPVGSFSHRSPWKALLYLSCSSLSSAPLVPLLQICHKDRRVSSKGTRKGGWVAPWQEHFRVYIILPSASIHRSGHREWARSAGFLARWEHMSNSSALPGEGRLTTFISGAEFSLATEKAKAIKMRAESSPLPVNSTHPPPIHIHSFWKDTQNC